MRLLRLPWGAWQRQRAGATAGSGEADLGAVAHRFGAVRQAAALCALLAPWLGSTPFEDLRAVARAESAEDGGVYVACELRGQALAPAFAALLERAAAAGEHAAARPRSPRHRAVVAAPLPSSPPPEAPSSHRRALALRALRADAVAVERALQAVAASLCLSLAHLHARRLCHGALSSHDVHVEAGELLGGGEGVSLSGYALHWVVGRAVILRLDSGPALGLAPPELLLLDPDAAAEDAELGEALHFRPQGDVWALGVLLAGLVGLGVAEAEAEAEDSEPVPGGESKLSREPAGEAAKALARLRALADGQRSSARPESLMGPLVRAAGPGLGAALDADFIDFCSRCLYINPSDRDTAGALCQHPFVARECARLRRALALPESADPRGLEQQGPLGGGTTEWDLEAGYALASHGSAACALLQLNAGCGDEPEALSRLRRAAHGATRVLSLDAELAVPPEADPLDGAVREAAASAPHEATATRDGGGGPAPTRSPGPALLAAATAATPTAATMITAMLFSTAASVSAAATPESAPGDRLLKWAAKADNKPPATTQSASARARAGTTAQADLAALVAALQDSLYLCNALGVEDEHRRSELDARTRAVLVRTGGRLSCSLRGALWVVLLGCGAEVAPRSGPRDAFAGAALRLGESQRLRFEAVLARLDAFEHDLPLLSHDVDAGAAGQGARGPHCVSDHGAVARQIAQDVPRCHQYHRLLRSPESRRRLTRLLMGWVLCNPGSQYWQGLDSVAAAVAMLYPGNEPVALAVLHSLVRDCLPGLFLRDDSGSGSTSSSSSTSTASADTSTTTRSGGSLGGSRLLHARLAVVEQLLAFHNPALMRHLERLGVKAEHFCVSWVLTMFAHSLPLPLVHRVWDALLCEAPAERGTKLVLFVVSVLCVLTEPLLAFREFGECVAFLTRLPVSLDRLVDRALALLPRALALTPRLVHLSAAEQRAHRTAWPAPCRCSLLPARELLRLWPHCVVVDPTVSSSRALRGAVPCVEDPLRALKAVERALEQGRDKWLIVVVQVELERLEPLLLLLTRDSCKPFVCVLLEEELVAAVKLRPDLVLS